MATVKTAISIDKRLYDQIERLARRRGVSRSRMFAEAAAQYLAGLDTRDLIERINRANAGEETPSERRLGSARGRSLRRLVEGAW